jgi:hypothetical protein
MFLGYYKFIADDNGQVYIKCVLGTSTLAQTTKRITIVNQLCTASEESARLQAISETQNIFPNFQASIELAPSIDYILSYLAEQKENNLDKNVSLLLKITEIKEDTTIDIDGEIIKIIDLLPFLLGLKIILAKCKIGKTIYNDFLPFQEFQEPD